MTTTTTNADTEFESKNVLPRNLVNPLATLSQYSAYLDSRARRRQHQSPSSSLPNPKDAGTFDLNQEHRGLNPADFAVAILRTGHTLCASVQPVVGSAIVLFQRYILLSAASAAAVAGTIDPSSFVFSSANAVIAPLDEAAIIEEDTDYAVAAAACLFVAAKTHHFNGITYEPITMLAVYNYHLGELGQRPGSINSNKASISNAAPITVTLPELYRSEMEVLRQLCFTTGAAVRGGAGGVVLPYSFALTYLQVLKLTTQPTAASSRSSSNGNNNGDNALSKSQSGLDQDRQIQSQNKRLSLGELVWRLVTDSLVRGSDCVLHTVHQPNTLACACIYLACAHLGIGVSGSTSSDTAGGFNVKEWWMIFDVRTDDFEHCLVALLSMDLL
ncbi:hypothetical protein D0Z00_004655 [Geotrichum galactomycetum]|uniref:Uncharacterized protein n=1 Tax=Geotrichum galactomycetum TaxID=27317 RepID=A0ACB6UXU3_9ASCO|nr:hypothetical protein D0Z00_004655 [Geotrichum candidum]